VSRRPTSGGAAEQAEQAGGQGPAGGAPTHPLGLYCVIDDFLATYSDGSEDCAVGTTVEEEYSEIADNYDEVYEAVPLTKKEITKDNRDFREMADCLKQHDLFSPYNSDLYYSSLYRSLYKCNRKQLK
jgi:hypothetical protein